MATEQDTGDIDLGIRPQTPAARRRNPAANRQRSAAERERLRAESRARRRARAGEDNGATADEAPPPPKRQQSRPPEPHAAQITVRRLSEDERQAPERSPSPPEAPERSPSPPEPPQPTPSGPGPATPAAERGLAQEELAPELDDPLAPEDDDLLAPDHDDPLAPEFDEPPAKRPLASHPGGPLAPAARSLRESFAPRLPSDLRERGVVLLAIASAVGVLVALATSLGSGSLPGFGSSGMRLEASAPAVAPGGWLRVEGKGAPADSDVVLESRSPGSNWRGFGEGSSDGDGDFVLKGRVLENPGRVQVRARVPGAAAATPIAVVVRPLRFASVGDINLGDVPGEAIAANGPRYPWEGVGKALREADLSFGNLECAISTRGEPFPKQYNFRGTQAALAGLKRYSGIDVLNLANNHVGDYGPEATVDTVRSVERLGMEAVGAGPDLNRALAPQVVERLGLKVAFVGFSEIAPVEFAAEPDRPGTAWAAPEAIAGAVQAARREADIVVATFHWGIEKQTLETARQRELADVAVRAGAQVVIGAHPHTLQPVRRQGGAIVAYSLGNFVFGAQSPETSTTGILELGLTAEGVTKADWHPARISGGRPMPEGDRPKRIPLRDSLAMEAGVNLF
jgi:poly-gamma-glutamate capsule biosynthesis protein CapA/YwtB (metallophosphatase superfamily)